MINTDSFDTFKIADCIKGYIKHDMQCQSFIVSPLHRGRIEQIDTVEEKGEKNGMHRDC